jgi:hypothetical protein
LDDLKYAQERAAILGTAVGLARFELEHDNPNTALTILDQAAQATHELLRDALVEAGADPAKVDALLGKS